MSLNVSTQIKQALQIFYSGKENGSRKSRREQRQREKQLRQADIVGQAIKYGLKMQKEERAGIIPAYYRPLRDKIEFVTAIIYENSEEFRDAIRKTEWTLQTLNLGRVAKRFERSFNRAAQEFMLERENQGILQLFENNEKNRGLAKSKEYSLSEERFA